MLHEQHFTHLGDDEANKQHSSSRMMIVNVQVLIKVSRTPTPPPPLLTSGGHHLKLVFKLVHLRTLPPPVLTSSGGHRNTYW